MNVVAGKAGACLAIGFKGIGKLRQKVGIRTKMAEMLIAFAFLRGHFLFHVHPIVEMKGIPFDGCSSKPFAVEDLVEGLLYR